MLTKYFRDSQSSLFEPKCKIVQTFQQVSNKLYYSSLCTLCTVCTSKYHQEEVIDCIVIIIIVASFLIVYLRKHTLQKMAGV